MNTRFFLHYEKTKHLFSLNERIFVIGGREGSQSCTVRHRCGEDKRTQLDADLPRVRRL